MAIFDAIRAKLADFGQDVANQSEIMTKSAQIQETISLEEKELNLKYQALGRAYYARQQMARSEGAQMLLEDISAFEGIEKSLNAISLLEKSLDDVRSGSSEA